MKPLRVVDLQGHNLLSKRQEEVATLVAHGLTNRELSEQSQLSEHSVTNYLFTIFDKLGISTQVELIFYALSQSVPTSSVSDTKH